MWSSFCFWFIMEISLIGIMVVHGYGLCFNTGPLADSGWACDGGTLDKHAEWDANSLALSLLGRRASFRSAAARAWILIRGLSHRGAFIWALLVGG